MGWRENDIESGVATMDVAANGRRWAAAAVDTGRSRVAGTDTSAPAGDDGSQKPAGAMLFYLVAVMSMAVSVDTSWRFFEHVLGIANVWERFVMFAVIEVALIACGYGMRANVIRHGRPGAPRLFAWLLCGLAGYMAWQLSGLATGIARVALGPVLGLVMLHLALGIEVRARRGTSTTTWARVSRELRERMLSWFGLGDDERDAVDRTRDRAARRVARLALGRLVLFRSARVARALRRSNVAHDDTARERMLTELAAIRYAADLATLNQPSPWNPEPSPVNTTVNTTVDPPTHGSVHRPGNATAVGSVTSSVNGARTATRTRTAASRERSGGRRTSTRTSTARRPMAGWVAAAREHLTPEVEITPAWVRDVVPDCPRSTSKNVADALKADREQSQPKEDA